MQSDQVTRFLLGALPEDEMQRLGELLQHDEQFQQRVEIVTSDLVECFVRGQLRGDDLTRFRRYFLAQSANRERVKLAQGFLDDLTVVGEAAEPGVWQRARARLWTQSVQAAWASIALPVRVGLFATTLVLLVICLWLTRDWLEMNRRHNEQLAANTAQRENNATLAREVSAQESDSQLADERIRQIREQLAKSGAVALPASAAPNPLQPAAFPATPAPQSNFPLRPAERSAASVPEFALKTGADEVLFQLDVGRDKHASYRAELRAQPDGQKVWASGTLRASAQDADKHVEVKIPTLLLSPRAYTLKVFGANGAQNADAAINYSFRITKQ